MDGSSVDLSGSQQQIVTAIVNEYQETGEPVKSGRIAEIIDRTPGTVRNQMVQLTSLGVVEGVLGPEGGYEPTEKGLALLERGDVDDRAQVTLAQDFDRIDITVDEITLPNVHHPTECRAHVHFQATLEGIEPGDPVVVGPTPQSELVVSGVVVAVLGDDDRVLLDVSEMEAPLTD
jgi:predicted transcriptional regulator